MMINNAEAQTSLTLWQKS